MRIQNQSTRSETKVEGQISIADDTELKSESESEHAREEEEDEDETGVPNVSSSNNANRWPIKSPRRSTPDPASRRQP